MAVQSNILPTSTNAPPGAAFAGPVVTGNRLGPNVSNVGPNLGLSICMQQIVLNQNGATAVSGTAYLPKHSIILDIIADTLTFHAIGEQAWRDRDAVQWLGHSMVRVPEGQVRTAARVRTDGSEAGIEACLVVSRLVDRATGEMLATEYMLCDAALAGDAARVARWSRWADAAEEQFRTLRHAVEHFAQEAGQGGDAADGSASDASTYGHLVSIQLGLTTLRLQHTPSPTAPAFLSRLAGRALARVNAPVQGSVLNEGMGRLLALLDVLENYPGRSMAATGAPASEPVPQSTALAATQFARSMDAESADAMQMASMGE